MPSVFIRSIRKNSMTESNTLKFHSISGTSGLIPNCSCKKFNMALTWVNFILIPSILIPVKILNALKFQSRKRMIKSLISPKTRPTNHKKQSLLLFSIKLGNCWWSTLMILRVIRPLRIEIYINNLASFSGLRC